MERTKLARHVLCFIFITICQRILVAETNEDNKDNAKVYEENLPNVQNITESKSGVVSNVSDASGLTIKKQETALAKFASDLIGVYDFNITLTGNITNSHEVKNESSTEGFNKRFNCSLFILKEDSSVIILKNDSQLTEIISASRNAQGCFLLYFYVQWCEFCAQMSVDINTIGRVYYGLPVIAVDAYDFTSIAGKYGITGVPTLIMFYNGRPVVKYNRTRSLHHLENFIIDYTGFHANESLLTIAADHEGPLPTKYEEGIDSFLVISMICLVILFILNILRSDSFIAYFDSRLERFKFWALHGKTD